MSKQLSPDSGTPGTQHLALTHCEPCTPGWPSLAGSACPLSLRGRVGTLLVVTWMLALPLPLDTEPLAKALSLMSLGLLA